jgi:hypothetical protein
MLKGMLSSRLWERIIENEEDSKKIEGSFKRIDEYTKDFQVIVTIQEPLIMLMQSSSARNCVED